MTAQSPPQGHKVCCPNILQLLKYIAFWEALTNNPQRIYSGITVEEIVATTKIPTIEVIDMLGDFMGNHENITGCVVTGDRQLSSGGRTAQYSQRSGCIPLFVVRIPVECSYRVMIE